jgi:phytoene dehydrogenase-like protein
LEQAVVDGDIPREYMYYTVRKLAYDLFESPQMRIYFCRMIFGGVNCTPNDVPGLYGFLRAMVTVFAIESTSVPIGGTHAITHALQRAFSARGGEFFVMSEVDKVLVENGRAVGVRLADGTEVRARKFVVSTLGAPQIVNRLLRDADIPDQVRHRAKAVSYDRGQIYWGDLAVRELPQYRAADFNPDIQDPQILFLCENDQDYFFDRWEVDAFHNGYASKRYPSIANDTRWDPSRAPAGLHHLKFDDLAPPLRYLSEEQWLKNKKTIVPELTMDFLQKLAPNMTRDKILGHHFEAPYDVARRNIDMYQGGLCNAAMTIDQIDRLRPFPELAGYKTPIKDLYHCGADTHPGVGIGRGNEVCCYKIIAKEYELPPIPELGPPSK